MPDWYEFYDERMGTGALLLLPDIRGKKENYYIDLFWDWKNKRLKSSSPSSPPPPPETLFCNKENYTKFMDTFENNYLNLLHKYYLEGFKLTDEKLSRRCCG